MDGAFGIRAPMYNSYSKGVYLESASIDEVTCKKLCVGDLSGLTLEGIQKVKVEDLYVERIDGVGRYKRVISSMNPDTVTIKGTEIDTIDPYIRDDRTLSSVHVDLMDGYPEGYRVPLPPTTEPGVAVKYGVTYTKVGDAYVKSYTPTITADDSQDSRLDLLDPTILTPAQIERLENVEDASLPDAIGSIFSPFRLNRRTIYMAQTVPKWQGIMFESSAKPTTQIESTLEWVRVGGDYTFIPFDKIDLPLEDPQYRWAWTPSHIPDIEATFEDGTKGRLVAVGPGGKAITEVHGTYKERYIPTRVPNIPIDAEKGVGQVLRVTFNEQGVMKTEPGVAADTNPPAPPPQSTLVADRESKVLLEAELTGLDATRDAERLRQEATLRAQLETDMAAKSVAESLVGRHRAELEEENNADRQRHANRTALDPSIVGSKMVMEAKRAEVSALRRLAGDIDTATNEITLADAKISDLQSRRVLSPDQARELFRLKTFVDKRRIEKRELEARFTNGASTITQLQAEISILDKSIKADEAKLREMPMERSEHTFRLERSIATVTAAIRDLETKMAAAQTAHDNAMIQLETDTDTRKADLQERINTLDTRIREAVRIPNAVARIKERYSAVLVTSSWRPSYHKLYVPFVDPTDREKYEWVLDYVPGWAPNATMNSLIRKFSYDFLKAEPARETAFRGLNLVIPVPPPPLPETPEHPRPQKPITTESIQAYKNARMDWRKALGVEEGELEGQRKDELEGAWFLREFIELDQIADVVKWKKSRSRRRRALGISKHDTTSIEGLKAGETEYDWLKREDVELTKREDMAKWRKTREERIEILGLDEDDTIIEAQKEGETDYDWLKREDEVLTRIESETSELRKRRVPRRKALGIAPDDTSVIPGQQQGECERMWLKREDLELERLENEVKGYKDGRTARRDALGIKATDKTTILPKQKGESDLMWLRRENAELDRMDEEVKTYTTARTTRRAALGIPETDVKTIPTKKPNETVLGWLIRESGELDRLDREVAEYRSTRGARRQALGIAESDMVVIEGQKAGESVHAWLKRESAALTTKEAELRELRVQRNRKRDEMGLSHEDTSITEGQRQGETEVQYLRRDIQEMDNLEKRIVQLRTTRDARRAALGIAPEDVTTIPKHPSEPEHEYLIREDRELTKLEAAKAAAP